MRTLSYLNTVEIDEFNLIKNSKKHETRNRLNGIQNLVVADYDLYLTDFANIHQINASTYDVLESVDLRGCYKIKTAARDDLLSRIVNIQTIHFKHICPYCLLLPRTTYDHYIPEAIYPVYSVLAKNLLPCCITCNGKKLEYWRANGGRTILHYYNDTLPQVQFLFGSLSFNLNNIPVISFNLHQAPGITNELFSIIQTHFYRLDLNNRYSENLDLVVSDIIDDVSVNRAEFGNAVTNEAISNIILHRSTRLKSHYGTNYWKAIALNILAGSPQFISTL